MPNEGRVFVARNTFVANVDGVPQAVHKGVTRVREGHEILVNNPQFFEEVGQDVHYEVESATSEPGEKRSVPTRKGAKSTDDEGS
jgi:hypothetical protein